MLQHHTFHHLPALAFRHPLVGAPAIGFHGGPAIQEPEWRSLRHTRYFQPVDWFDGCEAASKRLAGEYVYVGPVYSHFGHVMAEMVHRLLPAAATAAGKEFLLISTIQDHRFRTFDDLPSFYREILTFFRINPSQIVILNEDHIVERLHVFEQGSDFGGGPKPGYLDDLAVFADGLLNPLRGSLPLHRKVYVSRSALPGGGGVLGERYIERLLMEQGFYIARPETMPLIEQMHLYRNAEFVIFPEGSACHGVELMGTGSLGTVMFLARRPDHLEIFKRVLAPRSKEYVVIDPLPGTGSIFGIKRHNTVGMTDLAALVSALRERGACGEIHVDMCQYVDDSKADLASHIAYFSASDPEDVDGASVLERTRALTATFQQLMGRTF